MSQEDQYSLNASVEREYVIVIKNKTDEQIKG
jgi:hypothetical protein